MIHPNLPSSTTTASSAERAPVPSGKEGQLTVLYNGDCPVCSAGIAVVRRLDANATHVRLVDIHHTPDVLIAANLTEDDVVRRLYAQGPDGHKHAGFAAFTAIGDAIPSLRGLSRVARWPVIGWLGNGVYERALVPVLYRWNKARARRRAGFSGAVDGKRDSAD